MSQGEQIRNFIIEYIKENGAADVLDADFQDEFYTRFGGTRKEYAIGSQPVAKAQRWLYKMYQEGTLERGIIPLSSSAQPGFPNWVYGYTLAEAVTE